MHGRLRATSWVAVVAAVAVLLAAATLGAAAARGGVRERLRAPKKATWAVAQPSMGDGFVRCAYMVTNADVNAHADKNVTLAKPSAQCSLCEYLVTRMQKLLALQDRAADGAYTETTVVQVVDTTLSDYCDVSASGPNQGCCRMAKELVRTREEQLVTDMKKEQIPEEVCHTATYCPMSPRIEASRKRQADDEAARKAAAEKAAQNEAANSEVAGGSSSGNSTSGEGDNESSDQDGGGSGGESSTMSPIEDSDQTSLPEAPADSDEESEESTNGTSTTTTSTTTNTTSAESGGTEESTVEGSDSGAETNTTAASGGTEESTEEPEPSAGAGGNSTEAAAPAASTNSTEAQPAPASGETTAESSTQEGGTSGETEPTPSQNTTASA